MRGLNSRLVKLMSGSLLIQIIQVGAYPILLAQILDGLSMPPLVVGLYLALSWLMVLAVGPFVPGIIRRWGYRRALWLSFFSTSLSLILVLISYLPASLFVSAVLMGCGLIVRWIACDSLVVEHARNEQRGSMIGLHEALMGLGIGVGPLLFIQFSLAQAAMMLIVLGAAGQFLLLVTPSPNAIQDDEEIGLPFRQLYGLILAGLLAAFVGGYIENAAIALFPLYFEQFSLPLATSALLVSAFGFGGTLLQPPLGQLSDAFGHGMAQALCICVIAISAMAMSFVPLSMWALAPVLFALGGAAGGLNTLAVIQAGQTLSSRHIPAAMTAVALLYTLGSIAGPVVSGALLGLETKAAMTHGFAVVACRLGVLLLAHATRKPGQQTDADD